MLSFPKVVVGNDREDNYAVRVIGMDSDGFVAIKHVGSFVELDKIRSFVPAGPLIGSGRIATRYLRSATKEERDALIVSGTCTAEDFVRTGIGESDEATA